MSYRERGGGEDRFVSELCLDVCWTVELMVGEEGSVMSQASELSRLG